MRTPASIAGHPIHPMLVTLPIGLWVFSFVCDLVYAFGSVTDAWKTAAFFTMAGGLVGALAAAIPGLIDLLSLPPGIRSTAIKHMAINLAVVAIYAINLWLRASTPDLGAAARGLNLSFWLSLLTIAMLLVSGWLGGKLVYEAGVGVSVSEDPIRR